MTRATRIRILVFVVLSAVGIVYVAANYLGVVDKLLGRGYTIHATLPTSGGLFVGSEVDYRGVKIGRISSMEATTDGVRLDLALDDQVRVPLDSAMYVHNLSAVGEQYLEFDPTSAAGPYATSGDTIRGSEKSLPVDEGDLLMDLNQFVTSVDRPSLKTLISQLGLMFEGTGRPLQQIIDEGGRFIDTGTQHTGDMVRLLDNLKTVLGTQERQGDDIKNFATRLSQLTGALRHSDGDLRTVIDKTPGTAGEIQALLKGLSPTLPVLLSDLVNVNSVVVSHLPGLEQLLVTYPRVIAGGFTGTTPDGFGHVNLQMDQSVSPCTKGYKPVSQWRSPNVLTDSAIYPARCTSGPPYVMRGANYVPGTPANPSPPRTFSSSYDPRSGVAAGMTDRRGKPVRFDDPGDLSIMGDDSWKWLIVGPVSTP